MRILAAGILRGGTFAPLIKGTLERYQSELSSEFAQWERYTTEQRKYPERAFWLLTEPTTIEVCTPLKTIQRTYEVGYITDFGSVPSWAHSIVSPVDKRAILAYLWHDGGYGAQPDGTTRGAEDSALSALAAYCGLPAWRRAAMYSAVRIGGGAAWKRSSAWKEYERRWVNQTIKPLED